MAVKSPPRINVSVDVHTPSQRSTTENISDPLHRISTLLPTRAARDLSVSQGTIPVDVKPDAILPPPPVTVKVHAIGADPATPARSAQSAQSALERYRISSIAVLPETDADGFRIHKGRRYVDLPDNHITMVAMDADAGLYRAKLASELAPSGPALVRDVDSGLWHPLNEMAYTPLPLTDTSLQAFRTDLDFSAAEPGSDGLFRHNGKLYAVVHGHAFQAMHDLDASTPTHKVWRIVNPKDPVATDSANIYRASRSGETRAITRNEDNIWVAILTGLRGGMRRNEGSPANMALLMQRYEPFQNAHTALIESSTQYDALWSQARQQIDTAARTAALVAVEVHLLKHIRKQTAFVQSLVDNRDWLTLLKSGGLFKEELHTFRVERVEYLNRLMAVMDLRARPAATDVSAENCKKIITHLNKKLKILDERQTVMEQIRKASPGAAAQLTELSQQVPAADRVNFNKLTLYVHLFADTPTHSPDTTMPSLSAIDLITGDLRNVPEREHPMVLLLALDQLRGDRSRFETLLAAQNPKSEYLEEIIALIEPIEKRIENKLTEILDVSERRTDLPSFDQDIDFDFIPAQPVNAEASRPAPAKKMFRTRQHGNYRVLVGETEAAADGSITINVPDPLRPDSPPRRYKKIDDEWLPVLPPIIRTPRPQLIAEANRLLAGVEDHRAYARTQEAQKANPTKIVEDLGKETHLLNEQARQLENHETEVEDRVIIKLAGQLRAAADALTHQGQETLARMYKNKDVLDIMRLNYLLDRDELRARKRVDRKQSGKGKGRSFLDVYSISDRRDDAPLWEAHFHYDRQDSHRLNFTVKGGHLKTLEQSRRGAESQRRDEQAGLAHVAIWRETFDGKTAQKIFLLADSAEAPLA